MTDRRRDEALQRAHALLAEGMAHRAEGEYLTVLELDPDCLEAQRGRAEALILQMPDAWRRLETRDEDLSDRARSGARTLYRLGHSTELIPRWDEPRIRQVALEFHEIGEMIQLADPGDRFAVRLLRLAERLPEQHRRRTRQLRARLAAAALLLTASLFFWKYVLIALAIALVLFLVLAMLGIG
jgi:hypothetical protein